eukprot:SM000396S15197  [mRNA]  locus=s396:33059:33746:+ [translate_table: standard]
MRGSTSVGKAFLLATVLVFGGGTLGLVFIGRRLGAMSLEELPERGREALRPWADRARRMAEPVKHWAQGTAARWRMTREQQEEVGQQYAQRFGVKRSDVGGHEAQVPQISQAGS